MYKRYPFKHTLNTRDLGGYPIPCGATAFGRYIRSDAPVALADEEAALMRDLGVTTVIDLRSPGEREQVPCAFRAHPGFAVHDIRMDETPMHVWRSLSEEDVPALYFSIAQNHAVMRALMTIIARAPGGVFFHCTAGKDRTGITAALLLLLAGVSVADVVADYQVTFTYIRPFMERMLASDAGVPAYLGMSKPEYIEGFVSRLTDAYGTAENYLLRIGLTPEDIAAIRGTFTA